MGKVSFRDGSGRQTVDGDGALFPSLKQAVALRAKSVSFCILDNK
ncbi:hypothetical protein PS639_05973 [Pseudomonas fluorescens]|nr:hypothetical protein PS639_05973 [Pseudomonas fluorescens]